MAELPPNWAGFIATIEGRQSTFSAPMIDGKPAWGIEGIGPGSEQNFSILVEVLRGDAPLPREVRSWLADIFDEHSGSELQVKALSRRHRGKPPAGPGQHFEAVRHFRDLVDGGMSRQRALEAAGTKAGIKRSTIEKAIAEFEEAEEQARRYAWTDEP
ncbi:hypothetical protein GGQ91_004866 [Methylobacterium fujisawaense]|uniref:Uncharacterized protein n=1 Tax=Methylobacterium fujisawaense TaxID=107400 RepID=A0ABR6DH64_9HYPH|nr:hypothetical protein [Methylobacterium fujisawaense]MBA9065449.1 hypothetical protein [Methylobacterium fujisawaense]